MICRWHEFCQDVSLEKAGWFMESPALSEVHMSSEQLDHDRSNYLETSGKSFTYEFSSGLHVNVLQNQSSLQRKWYEML